MTFEKPSDGELASPLVGHDVAVLPVGSGVDLSAQPTIDALTRNIVPRTLYRLMRYLLVYK
jgi:hypothetical protein